jgi:general secretion pathway protein G
MLVDFFARHKTVLGMFKVDCGRYPTTEEGLNALIIRPKDILAHDWRGPYFDPPQRPKDPWGRDYIYRCPGIHNTDGFDLYSCGPDGLSQPGGEDADDINNWNSECYMRRAAWTR